MTNNQVLLQLRRAMADVDTFIETCSTIKLREYQRGVAEAIFRSVQERAGRSFVVMFPRQSGKNELQAQLETYLLCCFYLMDYVGERFGIMPEIFIAGDNLSPAVFTNDEHRMKVRHFLACWVNDFRPLHKSNVA
jgi:hypothetical protein